jgi:hypothetical protein
VEPFNVRADRVLEQARELASRVTEWTLFSNILFAPDTGIVAQAFPASAERKRFYYSEQYTSSA